MSARRLKRAMEQAHFDGEYDGRMGRPRDPGRRGVELGWADYLRWAYDAGYRSCLPNRPKVQRPTDAAVTAFCAEAGWPAPTQPERDMASVQLQIAADAGLLRSDALETA